MSVLLPSAAVEAVIDDTIYTSGPLPAWFDATRLLVLKSPAGEGTGALVELAIEYDPRPPFRTRFPANSQAWK